MIILKGIRCKYLQSVQVELPRANMVIDPRPIDPFDVPRFRCDYHDNGTTVTLTNTDDEDQDEDMINYAEFSFRVYDPATETVPSFDSTIYTYMGEDGEFAPRDTTEINIHPSVTVIKEYAFEGCHKIKKCFMHDGVWSIKECAFSGCKAMKVIRLSQSLLHIGRNAFEECSSLEAVFLPPSVFKFDQEAFKSCQNLRIFPLPLDIDICQIGIGMLLNCQNLFQTTQILGYVREEYDDIRKNQAIRSFYRNQVPLLHKECLHTHVTRQTIQQCINTYRQATVSSTDHDGMTPLHILAMNPHADISALRACFDLDMSMVFVGDSRGNTPLDYLRVHRDSIDDLTSLISSLCMHWYAAAGLSEDNQETSTNMNKKRKIVN